MIEYRSYVKHFKSSQSLSYSFCEMLWPSSHPIPTPSFVSGLFKVLTDQDELDEVIEAHLNDCEQANLTEADEDV